MGDLERRLNLVTAPTDEPIDLAIAKKQVRREDIDDDDELIETVLIPAVRQRCEDATRRQLLRATWELQLDRFPCDWWLELPKPPLIDVLSVTYVDQSGVTQTWAASEYEVDAPRSDRCLRGRIAPVYGGIWPTARCQMGAVTIRFRSGYGTAPGSVPPRLKLAMLQDLGTMYENREDIIVGQGFVLSVMPMGSAMVYRQYQSKPRQ